MGTQPVAKDSRSEGRSVAKSKIVEAIINHAPDYFLHFALKPVLCSVSNRIMFLKVKKNFPSCLCLQGIVSAHELCMTN